MGNLGIWYENNYRAVNFGLQEILLCSTYRISRNFTEYIILALLARLISLLKFDPKFLG